MTKHTDVVQFPCDKPDEDEFSTRMQIVGTAQKMLARCLRQMREHGADDRQIAHILRDAADVLDGAEQQ